MKFYIVIPAHNEEAFIQKTLDSLLSQSHLASKIVVVNDNSTDNTAHIVSKIADQHPSVSLVNTNSSSEHIPGSKVINAFYKGYQTLDLDYDVICKFDADLIFPKNYLATICNHFKSDNSVGMAGGFCHIYDGEKWKLENLTNKDHIRGALKAYRKACFTDIGELKPLMGWDTADELLAQYNRWTIKTDASLIVKHLEPTGKRYNKKSKYKQGEAFYRLRYGTLITLIAAIKLALLKRKPLLIKDYMVGFWKAKINRTAYFVSEEEGAFIRNLRWKKIKEKLF